MSFSNIRVDVSESIATLTFDRPAVKNALNLDTVNECHRALDDLAQRDDCGVLIVTGAGETSFVSGADINDIRARTLNDGDASDELVHDVCPSHGVTIQQPDRPVLPVQQRTYAPNMAQRGVDFPAATADFMRKSQTPQPYSIATCSATEHS